MKLKEVHRDLLKEFPETEKIFSDKNGNIVFLCEDGKDYFEVSCDSTGYATLVRFFENRGDYYAHVEIHEKDKQWEEIKNA